MNHNEMADKETRKAAGEIARAAGPYETAEDVAFAMAALLRAANNISHAIDDLESVAATMRTGKSEKCAFDGNFPATYFGRLDLFLCADCFNVNS